MGYVIDTVVSLIAGGVIVRLFYAKAIAAAKSGLLSAANKL